MPNRFIVSRREWPIVHIIYPAVPTEADIDDLQVQLIPLYTEARARPVVTIADLRQVTEAPAGVRKKLASLGNSLTQQFPGAKIGEAIVATSALIRAAIHAHYLFRRDRGIEHSVFATPEEARTWARQVLSRHAAAHAPGPFPG